MAQDGEVATVLQALSVWSATCSEVSSQLGGRRGDRGPCVTRPLRPSSQSHRRLLAGDEGCHRGRTVFSRFASAVQAHRPGAYGASRATNLRVPLVAHSASDFAESASGERCACCALLWSFMDTVGEPGVSPSGPSRHTFCPALPSLQWGPWGAVPHLHRYYAPLRLPPAPLGSLRLSLASRYRACFTAFVGSSAGAWPG
jgi:hypothetical protein